MTQEKSAGCIVFRRKEGIQFLLLHYKHMTDYWDFPRGHIEDAESQEEAARREVREETGITSLGFVEGFREMVQWFYQNNGETVHKFVTFFLAETEDKKVTLSSEHVGYVWLSYAKALEKLTHMNAKEVLAKANAVIGE